ETEPDKSGHAEFLVLGGAAAARTRLRGALPSVTNGTRTRVNRAPAILALGLRLRLADLEAGVRVCPRRAGTAAGRAPEPVHLLAPASRHAGASGPRLRPDAGRVLPRHGLRGRARALGRC